VFGGIYRNEYDNESEYENCGEYTDPVMHSEVHYSKKILPD